MSQSPTDHAGQRAGTAEVTESDRHRLLADERRRVTLDVLAGAPTPFELEELARDVAVHEADGEVPRDDVIQGVAIALHHNHLPMMTDVGALVYDPASKRVESVRETANLL